MTLKSGEFTLCSGSFKWGDIIGFTWEKLTFPYIFLLVDCFKWALIGDIEKWRVHSVLWQFQMGGYHKFYLGKTDFSLYFLISWLFRMGSHWWHWKVESSLCALAVSSGGDIIIFTWEKLTFPCIFLLVDCFKWALIGDIEKLRVHSVLWQFQMGGSIVSFTLVNLKIWAHLLFYTLLHRRSFCITYERPNENI